MRGGDCLPGGIASGNSHRVVLVSPPATDHERLQDLVADGVGAARRAMAATEGLPPALLDALAPEAELIRRRVLEDRNLLRDDVRAALGQYADTAEAWLGAKGLDPAVAAVVEDVHRALGASHRVADLVAAGIEVQRLRHGAIGDDPRPPRPD